MPSHGSFKPFNLAIVSDLHLSQGRGIDRWRRLCRMLEGDDVAMVLVLGDLIWDGPMQALVELLAEAPAPVHALYGNGDEWRLGEYERLLGMRDKVVQCNDCLFALMWDALPRDDPANHEGFVAQAQWDLLEERLGAANRAGRQHLFIAAHVPPAFPTVYHQGLAMQPDTEARFWNVCQRHGVSAAFFGHVHQTTSFQHGGTEVVVLPSLNWNFLPVEGKSLPAGTWATTTDGGSYLSVQVNADGIEHTLIPVVLEDEV